MKEYEQMKLEISSGLRQLSTAGSDIPQLKSQSQTDYPELVLKDKTDEINLNPATNPTNQANLPSKDADEKLQIFSDKS